MPLPNSYKTKLGDELFNQVNEKIGDTELVEKDENLVPQSRVNEITAEKNEFKKQVDTLQKSLDTLKKNAKGNDELQTEITNLQTKLKDDAKSIEDDYKTKLGKMDLNHAIDLELMGVKAPDVKLASIKALLNMETIKMDGTSLTGLSDQVTALKDSDAYLFPVNGEAPNQGSSKGAGGSVEKNPFSKKSFNLTKQGEIYKKDPAVAERMKSEAENETTE